MYSDVVSIDDYAQSDEQSDDEPVADPSTKQYVHVVYQTTLSRYTSICINRVTDGLIAELGVAVIDPDSDQAPDDAAIIDAVRRMVPVPSLVSSSLMYV